MPAMLDDPTSPVVYRTAGEGPYPTAENPHIPSSIFPRPVTLRDRVTVATLIPFFSPSQVPPRLLAYLCENLNKEIEGGDTYPMVDQLSVETFGPYWFGNFAAVMVLGDVGGVEAVDEMERSGADWSKTCLGSFYVKPNYPGRSSHVCNGGFLVTPAARNKGVGKSMGQCYLNWAPQLGFTYSVFNLVYETNTASTRIWDSLGFKRIGKVPGGGHLKSFGEPVDALIYGRDLTTEGDNILSEERFDKIRYYLKFQLYPAGADRSEKSRLRSAATHYKLVGDKLMVKGKEVISDPDSQYRIAKDIHLQAHGGINKTTAVIANTYHWVRIKDTVTQVIKNCPECKDTTKPALRVENPRSGSGKTTKKDKEVARDIDNTSYFPPRQLSSHPENAMPDEDSYGVHNQAATSHTQPSITGDMEPISDYDGMAIDPQIMEQLQSQMNAGFPSTHVPFTQPGLRQYAGMSPLQQHSHPQHYAANPEDHFMTDAATVLGHDPALESDGEGSMAASEQLTQHLLRSAYVDTGGTSRFKQ